MAEKHETVNARDRGERRWRGLGVSPGIAVGRVLRIHGSGRYVYRAVLDEADIEKEVRRFRAAVRLARRQLLAIKERAERELGAEHAYIFDAHLLMLEDSKLLEEVEAHIERERVNAEWAVKVVGDRLLAVYAEIKDEYLRERGSDIEDVVRRLLVALSGAGAHARRLTEDAIIVAEELLPSAAAELDFAHVRAIVSDIGGWTSHTAIIARGLGIPAVVGVRNLYRRARTGDAIIVDATQHEVILHPSSETLQFYRQAPTPAQEICVSDLSPDPLFTLDGVEITLRANLELPAEYQGVRRYGAQGVGLYRSEFLWSRHDGAPTEEEQYQTYVEIAQLAGAYGAMVRLFDLGGEKLSAHAPERNPALGLRAIRFCLRHEDILRTQLRAVLRAAAHGHLDIVLPMVSDIAEARRTRAVLEEERQRLLRQGQTAGEVRLGAMIEVPSAVMMAEKLAAEVDFFSLGTNDLVQYLLAVDRSNDEVAEWFRSLHPAVLRSIYRTLEAARAAPIPAVVCGEMAATPAYALILVGLGARDLSMTASSIPRVRRVLRQIEARRARAIALESIGCATADEVEELVRVRLSTEWPHLFPPDALPPPKNAQ
ncbi:phosphoenolpyruvate--protein phosphotransferase [Pyrinomonas sp.]|uniref:phosphoenolpyruvate--protein phosphotransferase n=1 Tax=Pyrinomonas sp. TaxID=2080306 RepID=UPI0033309F6C